MNDQDRIDIFKDLFHPLSEATLLSADEALAGILVEERLISRIQADECLEIQKRQFENGERPLVRLGELLLRKGILKPKATSGGESILDLLNGISWALLQKARRA